MPYSINTASLRVLSAHLIVIVSQLLEVSLKQEISSSVHDKAAEGLALVPALLGFTPRQVCEVTGHPPTPPTRN